VFLNRERAITTAQIPSVKGEEPDSEVVSSSSRNSQATSRKLPFSILDETSKSFPKFNATGRRMLIKINSPGERDEATDLPPGMHYSINRLPS
jgi:hypothetical protein